jgi:hypothetical protein
MITFILGGIWHGAGWTFVFWGFLHGAALVIHRGWNSLGFAMPKVFAWFITFNFINIAWVFFRAKEWDDVFKVYSGMFGLEGIMNTYANEMYILEGKLSSKNMFLTIQGDALTLKFILLSFVLVLVFKSSSQYLHTFKFSLFYLLLCVSSASIAILHLTRMSEFLYFNF